MSTQPRIRGSGSGLRLLSIDGGGIRGLSALLILREILHRVQYKRKLDQIPRACDLFDLAGGTGTGGIIVIMLFRLRMPINDAIEAYVHLSKSVFSNKQKQPRKDGILFDASRLQDALVMIIQKALGIGEQAKELRMLSEDGPNCFVCAMSRRNMASPVLFRSYTPPKNPTYNCTVVEACRATTADMPLFPSVEIGEPLLKETCIGGSLRCNNPVKYVLEEAESAFPNTPISCVASIGVGMRDIIGMKEPNDTATAWVLYVLQGIATDCEFTSEDIAKSFSKKPGIYFRLNVDQGLQGVGLTDWGGLSVVNTHTSQYLRVSDVDQKVTKLVKVLIGPSVAASPPTTLSETEDRAFKDLQKSIAGSAYYDSEEPSSPSECLAGTRSHQIDMLMSWIEANEDVQPLFVVLGSAGSGKSSLLRTIAGICEEKKYLAASFFFSGTHSARNALGRLVATIAYQIAEAMPELRPYVARNVLAVPTIFSRSLKSQMQRLLLTPLSQLRLEYPDFSDYHRVIVIDALDECLESRHQLQFISVLSELLAHRPLRFRCLLSSRFNAYIETNVTATLTPWTYGNMILGKDDDDERTDIRKYLQVSIVRIRKTHPFGAWIPPGWPLESDLETVVKKSGGQFIYASTVIKYVESPNHNPHERLRYILGISTTRSVEDPFVELDALYRALMLSAKNLSTIIEILGIELVRQRPQFWTPRTARLSFDFNKHLQSLDADIVLAPLASVLSCKDSKIKFYHLSFAEFLLDPNRSLEYFVHPKTWQRWIVSRLVPIFYNHGCILPDDVEYLIKEATPGTNVHKAINEGLALIASHPNCLPSGGDFNIWPFVTSELFRQLHFKVSTDKITIPFVQHEGFLPFSVIVKLASANNLSNAFLLFELCRICGELQKREFLEPDMSYTSVTLFPLLMTYLAKYLDDQCRLGQRVLVPDDYLCASLRCLWYLQTPSRDIRSSLKEQFRSLHYLLPTIGIPNFLEDISSNLTRGALDILPILLQPATPSNELLATLKRPFYSEVISRSPSSSHSARGIIHDYLMKHDRVYQERNHTTGEAQQNPGADDPLPDFELFLHPRGSWLPPWIMN